MRKNKITAQVNQKQKSPAPKVVKKASQTQTMPDIIFKKITLADLQDYINAKNSNDKPNYSLNDFVNEQSNYKKNTIIIADLSNQKLGNKNSQQLVDLKGAIFNGTLIENTVFYFCNLEGAQFCDMHLKNVEFINSNINFVDFRHADLSSCKFGNNYLESPWNLTEKIKLSSTASCIRIYADIKNEIAKKNEQKRLIKNKRLEIRELKNQISLFLRLGLLFNLGQASAKYNKLRRELYRMQKGIFFTNHMIHTSFQNVFRSELCVFDPVLLKQETLYDTLIQKKFMPLSRQNLIDYFKKRKTSKTLSLNDFATKLYIKSHGNTNIDKNVKIIADLSSKINVFGNNEWNRLNLSELDFSNTDLSEVIFSGSNLRKCNFKGANLSRANFESTLIQGSIFNNTTLTDSNFYYADLSDTTFINSNLMHARLDWSVANNANFSDANMQFVRAPNANWRHAQIINSNMEYSDFTGTDFRETQFTKVISAHSIFDKAYFKHAVFNDCNVSESMFNHAVLVHSIWNKCIAQNVEMMHSDLSEIKISEYCNFEGANFSHSKLDGIKAPKAHFAKTIINHVKLSNGQLAASCLDKALLRFTNLSDCVLNESSCIDADFTGSKLDNVKMLKSNLTNSLFIACSIKNSNFSKSNFENADLRNTKFENSALDYIKSSRTKVNHNTKILESSTKDLDGQFYHYDEDDFVDIIFIEQLISNTQKIQRARLLYKLGPFASVVRLVSGKHKISKHEAKKLHNITLSNQKEYKKLIKELLAKEPEIKNAHKFRFVNLLKHSLFLDSKTNDSKKPNKQLLN